MNDNNNIQPRSHPARNRLAVAAIAGSLALAGFSAGAAALEGPATFAEFSPLGAEEMNELRGGMSFGNLTFNFAVDIRTTVETATGDIGLTTRLTLDQMGNIQDVVSDVVKNGMDGITFTTPNGTGTDIGLVVGPDGAVPDAAALAEAITAEATRVLHQISSNSVGVVISNNLNDVTVNNATDFHITAPGFNNAVTHFNSVANAARVAREAARLGHRY
ncbi:hypothetical protein [Telmatospirillum sp. J64-1]|uniref:hypothetical protein n=1 Tax=Telmatospirillum sp. J64-1 TaxID=2502183 RepID=UPI00115DC05F|nr:hypothetical protein [Telmatospirillum sp. J64-1]